MKSLRSKLEQVLPSTITTKHERSVSQGSNSAGISSETKAEFIESMDCAPVSKLPGRPQWLYEIKLDGYRAIAPASSPTSST